MEFSKEKHKAIHMVSKINVSGRLGFRLTFSVREGSSRVRTAKKQYCQVGNISRRIARWKKADSTESLFV